MRDRDSRLPLKRIYYDMDIAPLRSCKILKVPGDPIEFEHKQYKLFEAIDRLRHRRGYILVENGLDSKNEANRKYYIPIKKQVSLL